MQMTLCMTHKLWTRSVSSIWVTAARKTTSKFLPANALSVLVLGADFGANRKGLYLKYSIGIKQKKSQRVFVVKCVDM